MNTKKNYFIIALTVISLMGFSNPLFNVLIVSGKVLKNAAKVEEGQQFLSKEKVFLDKGAYLALLHHTGKTIELKERGFYSVDSLSKSIHDVLEFATQYNQFIINSFDKKNNVAMSYFGNSTLSNRGEKLLLQNPHKTAIFANQEIKIAWAKVDKAEAYQVYVMDNFANILQEKEIVDTNFALNLDGTQDRYVIKVVQKGASANTDQMLLSLYQGTENFQNLDKAFASQTAIDYLVKAKFYENKGLLLHAQQCYQKAKEIEPNPAYEFQYNQFLYRHVKIN